MIGSTNKNTETLKQKIKLVSHELRHAGDLNGLIDEIGDAKYVLLGEASHGTHEYYTWRAHISKRLIAEKNFSMIAVEGDWPDCYRLNRYVKNYPNSGKSAEEVLHAFNRWPTWMWANWEIVAFAEWLKKYNLLMQGKRKVGFYGLDVYSLWESLDEVVKYLEKKDPGILRVAKAAVECFEPYGIKEGFSYANRTYGLNSTCEVAVERLLTNIRSNMFQYNTDPEAVFSTEQNALVAVNAERYYNVMMRGGEAAWNVRDRHMYETLERLMEFHGDEAKIIIWEHNTHIGDARATDMKHSGLINVGQLVKEDHENDGVVRIGFGSYEGTVMAGYGWGAKMQKMILPKAKPGSWEHLLHEAGSHNKILFTKDIAEFKNAIGHRAVGVVYDPNFESGNYVASIIPQRYETFIYLDRTQALHSLHIEPDGSQMPETYPWGV